ncbi:prepilin-type N-terminal cleavage/methylation domain-containing protein [bacterium]|nr:prepilin-type N-terminal cleavage/methylation domain-containing protein [bacterium]
MKTRLTKIPARQHAFTLLEIMIASALLVMIVASIYSIWYSILKGSKVGAKVAENVQRARIAMKTVEDSLSTAQMFVLNGRYYSFLADTSSDKDFTRLSLVSRLPAGFPGSAIFGDLAVRRVTFNVEKGTNGEPDLVLRQVPVMMAADEAGNEYAIHLVRNVKFFRMEFYDRDTDEWVQEWQNTNQIPSTVRVALALGGPADQPDRPSEIMTRVVTVPSSAVLPQYQMAGAAGMLPPGMPPPPAAGATPINQLPSDQNAANPSRTQLPSILPH